MEKYFMKKNKLLPFFLFCVFAVLQVHAKNDTIKITNPTYFSDYERRNFDTYLQSGKPDILALSLCIDSTANETNEKEHLESIKFFLQCNKGMIDKTAKEKSKIYKLFKSANHSFFIQYDMDGYGSEFYKHGKFNCVTGSLFFSLIMDSLHIPYTIKEKPTHVFLLAYPSTFSLPVESTDANMKILIPDENFKKRYVEFLADSKLIQKADIATKGVEAIFNEKYYSDKDIKPVELIGLLYFNSGINYLNQNNFKYAFQQFEKAYLLYPSERIRYVMEASLLALVSDLATFNPEHADLLAKLANYSTNKNYHALVTDQFKNYTYKFLINENNEEAYEQIYSRLIPQVKDSAVKADISTYYFHERSRVRSIKNDTEGSWKYICQGYKANPQNLNLISRLQGCFIDKLHTMPYNDQNIILYDSLLNEYPVLKTNTDILRYGGLFYLQKAEKLFIQNQFTAGEKALLKFDTFLKENPNCNVKQYLIGEVYSSIASAYFRKQDFKKCKSTLERGLELSPGNEILIRKYKINVTGEIK